jgi:hypothetical protein
MKYIITPNTINIFLEDGEIINISSSHPKFNDVCSKLKQDKTIDLSILNDVPKSKVMYKQRSGGWVYSVYDKYTNNYKESSEHFESEEDAREAYLVSSRKLKFTKL